MDRRTVVAGLIAAFAASAVVPACAARSGQEPYQQSFAAQREANLAAEQQRQAELQEALALNEQRVAAYKLAGEQREADQRQRAQEEIARREDLKKLATRAEYARPLISRKICDSRESLSEARAERSQQARYESSSGVADLAGRRELGEWVVDAQDSIEAWKARLRDAYASSPMPCDEVAAFFSCTRDDTTCQKRTELLEEIWRSGGAVIAGDEEPPQGTE